MHKTDAYNFFLWAQADAREFGFGTGFIVWITGFFLKLGAGYSLIFGLFSLMGFIGIMLNMATVKYFLGSVRKKSWVVLLFFLSPNLHYWTVALGKDAFIYLFISLFLYCHLTQSYLKWKIFAILIVFAIRPHVALIIMLGAIFANFTRGEIRPLKILSMSMWFFVLIMFALFSLEYLGLNNLSYDSYLDKVESRQGINNHGGGGIDTASYSSATKSMSYMFRPALVIDDTNNVNIFMAQVENAMLLWLFGWMLVKSTVNWAVVIKIDGYIFSLTVIIVGLLVLSSTLSNLGIAMRQKVMLYPFVLVAWLCLLRSNQLKAIIKKRTVV
jgi:hypothetical protein